MIAFAPTMRSKKVKRLDLTGQRFGRLVAIRRHEKSSKSHSFWLCKCDCGKESVVFLGALRGGTTKSCGCWSDELLSRGQPTHGLYGIAGYKTWAGMHQRCSNPKNHKFKSYGARGIKVCDRWKSFELFHQDMGPMPKGHSLGRIDNDGDYCPENCRWETPLQQGRNKQNSRKIFWNGKEATLSEHAKDAAVKLATVRTRFYVCKWPVEKLFIQPTK